MMPKYLITVLIVVLAWYLFRPLHLVGDGREAGTAPDPGPVASSETRPAANPLALSTEDTAAVTEPVVASSTPLSPVSTPALAEEQTAPAPEPVASREPLPPVSSLALAEEQTASAPEPVASREPPPVVSSLPLADADTVPDPEPVAISEVPAPAETVQVAKEPGVFEHFVVLGQSAAFTGPAAKLGIEFRRGASLYFNHLNASGGVHGRNVILISRDDGYEPERTLANTRQLLDEDEVFALFGYVGTPTIKAVLPLIEAHQVPVIAPLSGAELLQTPFRSSVFNLRTGYVQETEALVEYALRTGATKFAVFYQNDSYGKAGLNGVRQALEERGLSIAVTGQVERNSLAVDDALARIAPVNPDAVILISAYASCAEFIRKARQAGLEARFMNVSFVGSKALATDLWSDSRGVVVSQVVPFPGDLDIPVVAEYNRLMQRYAPQSGISYSGLEGFLAAKALAEGLQQAGRELTRPGLIAALESFQNRDLGGFALNWNTSSHAGSDFIDITVLGENRRWLY